MNMFQQIKDAVSAREAASFYCLKVKRGGMCCCPFHDDRHPSMKVDKRFHCFGCGADGDVIDLVRRLFSLDAKAAAFKLIDDFHLNIETDRKETKHERAARIRQAREKENEMNIRKAYAEEMRKILLRLSEFMQIFEGWEHEYAPTKEQWENGRIDERFLCAVHNRDALEHILDMLISGSDEEKYEIFSHRKEIMEDYERKITGAE